MLLRILIGLFYIVLRHRGDAYRRKAEKRKSQGKSAGKILSPIKQKRKKEHTGGKLQQTEKAEAVEKSETKGKR